MLQCVKHSQFYMFIDVNQSNEIIIRGRSYNI